MTAHLHKPRYEHLTHLLLQLRLLVTTDTVLTGLELYLILKHLSGALDGVFRHILGVTDAL